MKCDLGGNNEEETLPRDNSTMSMEGFWEIWGTQLNEIHDLYSACYLKQPSEEIVINIGHATMAKTSSQLLDSFLQVLDPCINGTKVLAHAPLSTLDCISNLG